MAWKTPRMTAQRIPSPRRCNLMTSWQIAITQFSPASHGRLRSRRTTAGRPALSRAVTATCSHSTRGTVGGRNRGRRGGGPVWRERPFVAWIAAGRVVESRYARRAAHIAGGTIRRGGIAGRRAGGVDVLVELLALALHLHPTALALFAHFHAAALTLFLKGRGVLCLRRRYCHDAQQEQRKRMNLHGDASTGGCAVAVGQQANGARCTVRQLHAVRNLLRTRQPESMLRTVTFAPC